MSKLLGIIWIILGALWLARPEALKNRLKKKMTRKLRWIVYGFIIVFGLLLLGSIIKAEGLLLKIVGIAGLVIVIKGILLVSAKGSEKISDWWSKRPLLYFRIWALVILLIGIALFIA